MFHSSGKVEVLIAPVFESRIERARVLVAGGFINPMEELCVLVEEVVRSEVGSSSKPSLPVLQLKVTDVGAEGRHHGGSGMKNQRQRGCVIGCVDERVRIETSSRRYCQRSFPREHSFRDGGGHRSLLDQPASLDHRGDTEAGLLLPPVLPELRGSVLLVEGLEDVLLLLQTELREDAEAISAELESMQTRRLAAEPAEPPEPFHRIEAARC